MASCRCRCARAALGAAPRADRHRRRIRAVGPPQACPLRGRLGQARGLPRPGRGARPAPARSRPARRSARAPLARRAGDRRLVLRRRRPRQPAPGVARLRPRGAGGRRAHRRALRGDRDRHDRQRLRRRDGKSIAVHSKRLLNCAGAWARPAPRFGDAAPMTSFHPGMAVTEPVPRFMDVNVGVEGGGIYGRQTARGNCVMGGSRGAATRSRARRARAIGELCDRRPTLFPALAHAHVIRFWSGVEGSLPDHHPVVGPSPTTPQLIHAFGFCGAGFQIGPAVGEALAELVHTAARACRSMRFPSPGSRPRPPRTPSPHCKECTDMTPSSPPHPGRRGHRHRDAVRRHRRARPGPRRSTSA